MKLMYDNPRSALRQRTREFADSVLEYTKSLSSDARGQIIEKQLVRSATSVGANYLEASNARSRAEFVSKATITLQEAEESRYWLVLSSRHADGPPHESQRLEIEGHEIVKMLMASIRTAKNNQKKHDA